MDIFIGQARDAQVLKGVINILKKRGIIANLKCDAKNEVWSLWVLDKDHVNIAISVYCHALNIPCPSQIRPEIKRSEFPRVSIQPMTKILIISSIFLYLLFLIPPMLPYRNFFFISNVHHHLFYEILKGEIWRALTPIFLHFGFIHITFNSMWLKDLGSIVEKYYGYRVLLIIILWISSASNLAQYLIRGPNFGGLSGVVYGLFGFLWVTQKLNKDFPYKFPKQDIFMMIGWLFLCAFGLIGQIANMAHAVGLSSGMFAAIFLSWFPNSIFNFSSELRINRKIEVKLTKIQIKYFSISVLITLITLLLEYAFVKGMFYYKIYTHIK